MTFSKSFDLLRPNNQDQKSITIMTHVYYERGKWGVYEPRYRS